MSGQRLGRVVCVRGDDEIGELFAALRLRGWEIVIEPSFDAVADAGADVVLLNIYSLGEPGEWRDGLRAAMQEKIASRAARARMLIIYPPVNRWDAIGWGSAPDWVTMGSGVWPGDTENWCDLVERAAATRIDECTARTPRAPNDLA